MYIQNPEPVKLRKAKTRTSPDGKMYFAWYATLPVWMISAMGWKEGMEIEAVREGDAILLRRKE